MWIHLLRHGIAFDRADPACPPDPKRPLTEVGVRKTEAAAKGLRRLGIEPDAVLSSPYLRARQTADIVRDVLAPEARLQRVPALVPDGRPREIAEALAGARFVAPMCVGHAPSLDDFVAYLLGSDIEVTRLKKAGLAIVKADRIGPGGGRLHAVLPPAMLRTLAGL